jgi:hypothetical protein
VYYALWQKKETSKDKEAQAEEAKEKDEAQEQVVSCSRVISIPFFFICCSFFQTNLNQPRQSI